MSLSQYGCSLSLGSKGRLLPELSEWAILTGEEGMLILWLGTWNSFGGGRQLSQEGVFRFESEGMLVCSIRNWE